MIKLKNAVLIAAATLFLSSSAVYSEVAKPSQAGAFPTSSRIAVFNFRRCAEDSKMGREAEGSLMTLKDQLTSQLEPVKKELLEIIEKGKDSDYIASLSEEAKSRLQERFDQLSADYDNKSQQFDAILNEAKMRAMQELNGHMERAGQLIAKEKGIDIIVRNEALLTFPYSIDVTTAMIVELDKIYDREMQTQPSSSSEKASTTTKTTPKQ